MSYNSGVIGLVISNQPYAIRNYSPDFSLNCTPFSPITIIHWLGTLIRWAFSLKKNASIWNWIKTRAHTYGLVWTNCLKNKKNSSIRVQKSHWHVTSGCRNLSLALKREAVQFLIAKNLAVNHLPLEALLAFQTSTANCERDRKTLVTWHRQVCRLLLTMKNLMLKVSNNDIEFGKAGALVTLYVGSFLATNVPLLNVFSWFSFGIRTTRTSVIPKNSVLLKSLS